MNKAEKIVLSMGLLLWVVGDLVTTYFGWMMGLRETNPFLFDKSIFQLAMMKFIVVVIAFISISKIEKLDSKYSLLKIPIYTMFVLIGSVAVIGNTTAIIARCFM